MCLCSYYWPFLDTMLGKQKSADFFGLKDAGLIWITCPDSISRARAAVKRCRRHPPSGMMVCISFAIGNGRPQLCRLRTMSKVKAPRLPEPHRLRERASREGAATAGSNLEHPIIALGDVVV